LLLRAWEWSPAPVTLLRTLVRTLERADNQAVRVAQTPDGPLYMGVVF